MCSRKNILAYFILRPLLQIFLSVLDKNVIKSVILNVSFYGVFARQLVNFCTKDIVNSFTSGLWFVCSGFI